VTGRRSRFIPVLPSWTAFDTHGIPELDDVKFMFAFTQITGGRYFSPSPSETDTAASLKRAVAQSLGWPAERHALITAREWFRREFGP
jgi:hypothetical protein